MRRRSGSTWRSRDILPALGFLLPSLAGTAVFVLLPLLDAVRRSFYSVLGGRFRGLAAYRDLLDSERLRLAAGGTARFMAVCLPLLLALSLGLALAVYAAGDRGGFWKSNFLLPMAIPAASMVAVWQLLFHPQGIFNGVTGLTEDWLNTPSAFWVLVATYLWKHAGYDMVLWLAGLYAIPESRYEAAQVDGAGAWQRFRHITLPGLRPYVFLVAVLSVVNSFKVFREAYLLGGSRPHDSIYLLQHQFQNWFLTLDVDKLCAAAVLLALALFGGILLLRALLGEERE